MQVHHKVGVMCVIQLFNSFTNLIRVLLEKAIGSQLYNHKYHYINSPPLGLTLTYVNLVHGSIFYLLRLHLNKTLAF
jgi:hypothetical protein